MADVEAMYHKVKVAGDTALLKFIWWPGVDNKQDLLEHKMVVHIFGTTSSLSCASFALRKSTEDHRKEFDPDVANTVLHNLYVDDCPWLQKRMQLHRVRIYELSVQREVSASQMGQPSSLNSR